MEHAPRSIEAMLEHRDWIQRLALGLVADSNDADEVAQETWLAALRTPPLDDGRSPRGWLARVAQNAARRLGRARQTRRDRESAAAVSELAPSSDELIDRISVERSLVEDAVALPEPYRHTLLLRYFEELPLKAIASRTGVPLETVRTRLRRGLKLLRERIDRRHGADASEWLLALVPLGVNAGSSKGAGTGTVIMGVKSLLAWAASLTAIAFGAFLWQQDRRAPADVPLPPPTTAVVASAPAPAAPSARGEVDGGSNEGSRLDASIAAAGRVVRVVSAPDGTPLPGADVWFIESSTVGGWSAADRGLFPFDPEPGIRAHGQHLVCDDQGELLLPASDADWRVVARSGELYGSMRVSADGSDSADVLLKCETDRNIAVQVVDGSGAPVPGVMVGLRENERWIRWRQRTGVDGTAHFRHMGRRRLQDTPTPGSALHAVLDFPNDSGIAIPVSLDAPGSPRIVIPETGSLVVDFVDAEGEPYAADAQVSAARVHEIPHGRYRASGGVPHNRFLDGASRVEFPHVGLGLELRLRLAAHGVMKSVEHVVAGPSEPGEEVRVQVEVSTRESHFSGRVLAPPGTELGHATMKVSLEYRDSERWSRPARASVVTLDDGRFQLPLEAHVREGLECRLSFALPWRDAGPLWGRCEARAPAEGEERDCGTIQLVPARHIVGGVVTDRAGRPISGAKVALGTRSVQPSGPGWQELASPVRFTNSEGRFELIGELQPEDYRMRATRTGFADGEWHPFAPGDTDTRIVLDTRALLSGRVLVDAGFPAERLTVVASYPDLATAPESSERTDRSVVAHVQPDGQFHLAELPPGRASLVVRTGRYSAPLATVEDVEIVDGIPRDDLRIDLRGAAFETDIELVGRDGEPVRRGLVTVVSRRLAGLPGANPTYAIEGGRVSLITDHSPIDVDVVSPGLVGVQAAGLEASARVVLEGGPRVELFLPVTVELPPATHVLRVGLLPDDRDRDTVAARVCSRDCEDLVYRHRELEWSHGTFDADRRLDLTVAREGRYQVTWSLQAVGDPSGLLRFRPVGAASDSFRLEVTSEEASFTVAPDPESYAELLSNLR